MCFFPRAGVFGGDDEKGDGEAGGDGDDEVLAELKKKQAELRAISRQNVLMLRQLHKQAKDEMQLQDLRKKMAAVDAEVRQAQGWWAAVGEKKFERICKMC